MSQDDLCLPVINNRYVGTVSLDLSLVALQ